MELIIVRHGLSEANKADIAAGPNSPLAVEGKEQAEDLAKRLQNLNIENIISSPYKRTMQTSFPIADLLKLQIEVDNRLHEVSFGSLEGKPHQEIVKIVGKEPRELFNDYKYDFSAYGGETSDQVEARVRSFLDDLKKQDFSLVLIVTHGGIIRWINYLITGQKIGPSPNAEELRLSHK